MLFALYGCHAADFEEIVLADMSNTAQPNLSAADDGTAVLTYLQETETGATLYLRTRKQGEWSEPRLITEGQNLLVNWADFPTVLKGGSHLIAQWLVRQPSDGFAYDTYVAFSSDEGRNWTTPARLHTDTSAVEHGFVSLYANQEEIGAFWLDGQRYAADGIAQDAGMQLRHRLLNIDGAGAEELVDNFVCDCCQTDVAVSEGEVLVAYRDRTSTEIRDISVTRSSKDGWHSTSVAKDGWEIAGCPVNGPAIDAEDGVIGVAWYTAVPTSRVRIAFSSNGGRSFEPAIDVATDNVIGRVDVEMTAAGGRAYVSWLSRGRGEFAFRTVDRSGELGVPQTVTQMATHLQAGFPRMVKVDKELVFTWTDTSGGSPVVRTASKRIPD